MFEHCLYFNTTALARLLDKQWTIAFKVFDLTPSQAFLLRVVLDTPGSSPAVLAKKMAISRPTATRALDGLEQKGYVSRSTSDHDGREMLIFPTSLADSVAEALKVASTAVTKSHKKILGEELFASTVAQAREVRSRLD
jgi:MarR family transcriptional regulator, temperature-dependent positive regulator of motility